MGNDSDLWPIPREALVKMAKYAMNKPTLADALSIVDVMNHVFRGVNNGEAFEIIDSITLHFKEEVEKKASEQAMAYAERLLKQRFNLPELDVDDEHIAAAIVITVCDEIMESKRDWGGIYRILVDFCKWPQGFKEFERRVIRLKEMGLLQSLPHEKDFDYQALQNGISSLWPKTFQEWRIKAGEDHTLYHRLEVAKTFLNNLKSQQGNIK